MPLVARRRQRERVLCIVEEMRHGKCGFNVGGCSLRGKPVRRFYLSELAKRLARFSRDIGPDRIVSEDASIHGLCLGAQSMNNFRAVLSAAWSFAVRRGYARENVQMGKIAAASRLSSR